MLVRNVGSQMYNCHMSTHLVLLKQFEQHLEIVSDVGMRFQQQQEVHRHY
jgi:hypothetical protein